MSQFTRFWSQIFSWKWCRCQKMANMRYAYQYIPIKLSEHVLRTSNLVVVGILTRHREGRREDPQTGIPSPRLLRRPLSPTWPLGSGRRSIWSNIGWEIEPLNSVACLFEPQHSSCHQYSQLSWIVAFFCIFDIFHSPSVACLSCAKRMTSSAGNLSLTWESFCRSSIL